MAEDSWRLKAARADLLAFLEPADDCPVEIIMKDISTVRYQPQRLWEWEKMAMEEVEKRRAHLRSENTLDRAAKL
jgi:hypothetical protein